jgi:putative transposase
VLAKVPISAQAELKAAYWQIFQTDDLDADPGQQLVSGADPHRCLRPSLRPTLSSRGALPARRPCPAHHLPALPTEHHHRIRHSNFIERTFGETRRRVKVIGRLPGEASCLSLVWAVLDRASRGWRGVTQTPTGVRLLQDLRRQLFSPSAPKEVVDEAVAAAA